MKIGIVGLPNVGKSTLFKALTKKPVDASNYPFCTINPNIGVVAVPDDRLDKLTATSHSAKTIPTVIEFVDIAGLVKDAHKGEGLGNKFLSHIREVDAIVQVLRQFTDKNVTHVNGKIDPESDKETINLELTFADLETIKKRLGKNDKMLHSRDKTAKQLAPILNRLLTGLETGQPAREIITTEAELALIKDLNLLTIKPLIYVLNVDENHLTSSPLSEGGGREGVKNYIPISAKLEAELSELNPEEAGEYLKELQITESGLDKLIKEAYRTLNLITFFTSGEQESRAWTVSRGAKAPQAAGVIHTDFETGFIRAEIINWQYFVELGGEVGAKEKGLIRIEGKEYVMQDGDVCHFRHGNG